MSWKMLEDRWHLVPRGGTGVFLRNGFNCEMELGIFYEVALRRTGAKHATFHHLTVKSSEYQHLGVSVCFSHLVEQRLDVIKSLRKPDCAHSSMFTGGMYYGKSCALWYDLVLRVDLQP